MLKANKRLGQFEKHKKTGVAVEFALQLMISSQFSQG